MEEKQIKTASWTFKSRKQRWLTVNASRHAAVKGIIKGIVPPTAVFLAVALVSS